jgi:hypothetical protein
MPDSLQIIISGDYELFGNGAGDVRESVIRPTRRLPTIHSQNTSVGGGLPPPFLVIREHDETIFSARGYLPVRRTARGRPYPARRPRMRHALGSRVHLKPTLPPTHSQHGTGADEQTTAF